MLVFFMKEAKMYADTVVDRYINLRCRRNAESKFSLPAISRVFRC